MVNPVLRFFSGGIFNRELQRIPENFQFKSLQPVQEFRLLRKTAIPSPGSGYRFHLAWRHTPNPQVQVYEILASFPDDEISDRLESFPQSPASFDLEIGANKRVIFSLRIRLHNGTVLQERTPSVTAIT